MFSWWSRARNSTDSRVRQQQLSCLCRFRQLDMIVVRLPDTTPSRRLNRKPSKRQGRRDDPRQSFHSHELEPETGPFAVKLKGHHPPDCGAHLHDLRLSQFTTENFTRHISMPEPPTSYLSTCARLDDVSKSKNDTCFTPPSLSPTNLTPNVSVACDLDIDLIEATSRATEAPSTLKQDPLYSNSAFKNQPALRVPTGTWISQEVPIQEEESLKNITQVTQRDNEIKDLGPSHSAQLVHFERSPLSLHDEECPISQPHCRRGFNVPSAIDSDWYPPSAMSTSYDSQISQGRSSDINASCPQHCSDTVSNIQDGADYPQFETSTFTQYASAELSCLATQSSQRYIRPRKPDLYENSPTENQYWTFEERITISMLNAMTLAESCRGVDSGPVLMKPQARPSRIGFWNYISCRPDIQNDPYYQ